jgi:CRP-like cAMP-binding protein
MNKAQILEIMQQVAKATNSEDLMPDDGKVAFYLVVTGRVKVSVEVEDGERMDLNTSLAAFLALTCIAAVAPMADEAGRESLLRLQRIIQMVGIICQEAATTEPAP